MGKIHISDELKNKLDKVFSLKKSDINNAAPAVGPAPQWNSSHIPPPPPQGNSSHIPPPNNPEPQIIYQNIQKPDKKKKKKYKKYIYISKVVFLSSVVAGIGLTLGFKIGQIIFY